MSMRRLLGSVLPALVLAGALTGVLAGCGEEEPVVTDDPAPSPSSSPSSSPSPTQGSPGDQVNFELVEMITETAAGGSLDDGQVAVPLTDDMAVQEFVSQFTTEGMTTRVQDAVDKTQIPDDMLLYGAIVAIGCDSPGSVFVTSGDRGLVITAQKVPTPILECFAPMTTVALVLVPASAVG